MTSHELPSSSAAESPIPTEPVPQEHDPLFTLTWGDVQTVAQQQLGRALTRDETEAVMDTFGEALDWKFYVENCIQVGQERGRVGPVAAGYRREEDEPAEPVSQPVAATTVTQEQSSRTQFHVDYSLLSSMRVQATAEGEASEHAFATLHGLIGQADLLGVTPRLAGQVRLGHAEITIDGVEAVPSGEEVIEIPPHDLFEIASVSRDDLASCGFDASQVSDAQMEELVSKMADDYGRQLFWSSLTLIAETLGFPKRP